MPCGVRRGWCGGSPLLLTGFRSLNVGRTESLGLSLVSTDTSEGSAICSEDFPASLLCVTKVLSAEVLSKLMYMYTAY